MLKHLGQLHMTLSGCQPLKGKAAGVEGAKMLGAEIIAHRFAQVGVNVARGDGADFTVLVLVAEQMVVLGIVEVFHVSHRRSKACILHLKLVLLTALADEVEFQLALAHLGMIGAQGGCAVAVVGLGVMLVADADRRQVEQSHHSGQRPLSRDAAPSNVLSNALAHQREQLAEAGAGVIFRALLLGAEIGVVTVLLAPRIVMAGGEDVPVRRGAEPRVFVGGRESDRIEALLFACLAYQGSRRIIVGPALARPAPSDAGQIIVNIDQLFHIQGNAPAAGNVPPCTAPLPTPARLSR